MKAVTKLLSLLSLTILSVACGGGSSPPSLAPPPPLPPPPPPLPPPPSVRYLIFVEGNPGVPGDGVFVNASGGADGMLLENPASQSVSLGQTSDGITISVFPPAGATVGEDPENIFVEFRVGGSLNAQCGLSSDSLLGPVLSNVQSPIVHGVQGRALVISQAGLEALAQDVRGIPGCSGVSLSELEFTSLDITDINFVEIQTIDAVAIGFGESVFPTESTPPPGLSTGPESCIGGMAGNFSCSGMSLRKRVPNDAMGGGDGNDIWGWVDAQTGNEYALMGLTNGTAFVDVTDPENPVFLGHLATNTVEAAWRDIKVYMDHAYIVADGAGAHGMQVFDLTRLRGVASPQNFMPETVYNGFENAHNVAINEATGYAYAVGTNTCGEGLHMVDISTPNNPLFAGCHADAETHDTQCVVYQGPDADYTGLEICFSSNKDHLGIADVTIKSAAVTIFSRNYPDTGLAHQGWLTEDHRFFLLGDETDEISFNVPTRTLIFDVTDLDAPVFVSAYEAATVSIDHNLYILGNRVFQANYTSGVRVLEFGDLANSELTEIAFLDTFPDSDAASFDGLWSIYPFLPSGNIIASDLTNGLFILSIE